MNQRTTISAVLSVAAAAGITAGAVIHAASGPSNDPVATPSPSTVTSLSALRSPGARTTASISTVPASTKVSTSSKPGTSPAVATSQGSPTNAAPTATSRPKPAAPITANSLVGPSEFAAAGVARLTVDQTGRGGPQYDMSACPAVDGPPDLSKQGVVWQRDMHSTGPAVRTYQLLADFRSSGGADGQVKFLNDWHDHCGTPDPEAPSQNFTMGQRHQESVPGVDQARWWDLTFTNEGKRWMETVAWTRKGNRVNIVVFSGLSSDIRNTSMKTLITGMVRKAS